MVHRPQEPCQSEGQIAAVKAQQLLPRIKSSMNRLPEQRPDRLEIIFHRLLSVRRRGSVLTLVLVVAPTRSRDNVGPAVRRPAHNQSRSDRRCTSVTGHLKAYYLTGWW